MTLRIPVAVLSALLAGNIAGPAAAQDAAKPAAPPKSVAEVLAAHDRTLIRDLEAYARQNPKAADVDQAYLTLFDRILEHEWYVEADPVARRYLTERPDGPSRPIAQVIGVMAKAKAGQHGEALAGFQELLKGLNRNDQEEFAVQVADGLAQAAITASEYPTARKVFEALSQTFPQSTAVREKVADNINRLDKVGKPAPPLQTDDINGKLVKLADLRGKYVLVDFWATFCAPCLTDLPYLQAAYAKYHDQGFEVIGVSLDDTREAVVDFVKARKIPWRQIHNATATDDTVAAFGVTALPATYLIDPTGKIVRLQARGPGLDAILSGYFPPKK